MAWLHAIPEGRNEPRSVKAGEVPFPDIGASNLIDLLFEVGPVMSGGNPLTYQEIHSWSQLTGMVLTGWDANTIKSLSISYLSGLSKYKETSSMMPFDDRTIEQARVDVADKFKLLAKRHGTKL